MKLKLQNGRVVQIMPLPKQKGRPGKDSFAADMARWMYMTEPERQALMARLKRCRKTSFARREYYPWALANSGDARLPCEEVTVIPQSEVEEDAIRAYWDGWMEQCEKVCDLERRWPLLSRAERENAITLAELMAADLPIARGLLQWMNANLYISLPPFSQDTGA